MCADGGTVKGGAKPGFRESVYSERLGSWICIGKWRWRPNLTDLFTTEVTGWPDRNEEVAHSKNAA